MKKLIILVLLLFAAPLFAQVHSTPVHKDWVAKHELAQSNVDKFKQQISQALLEPDQCYYPAKSANGKEKISLKTLRSKLAKAEKHLKMVDKGYAAKLIQ
jgi:hypothetical protein